MEITSERLKEITCDFFRYWYNAPGNNTEQGFDEWWKDNKGRYILGINKHTEDRAYDWDKDPHGLKDD